MSTVFTSVGTFVVMQCGGCGVSFAMTEDYIAARKKDHKTFCCPNGCRRYYASQNEEERLRWELGREKSKATHLADQLEATKRTARSLRGHVTRVKNRVKNGVCPCCNRHFVDLERHMTTKHPKYGEEVVK